MIIRKLLILSIAFLCALNASSQVNTNELGLLMLSSNYGDALEVCRKLILNDPDNSELYYQQAIIYRYLYRYPEAQLSIQSALKLKPENIEYLSEYASILMKRNREKEAFQIFETILSMDKSNIFAGLSLSNHYLKNKKYDQAKDILVQLYSTDSLNGYFARNIGLCAIKLGVKKDALNWLNKAIALDSTDIKAYELLSITYSALSKFDLALENIDKAIHFDPGNYDLYVKAGDINVLRNHNYRAIPYYLKAYDIDADDGFLVANIGLAYYKIKKMNKAKEYLDRATKMEGTDIRVYEHLGHIHSGLNQPDSSILYYDKVLEMLKPDYESIFDILVYKGESYYKLNQYEKAIELFCKATDIELEAKYGYNSKHKVYVDIAAIYHEKLNNKLKAIEYYSKIEESKLYINKDYYKYAQQQITKLKEELFFKGKL